MKNSRGFTRDTAAVLLANIESKEWEIRERKRVSVLQEHSRASTTDTMFFQCGKGSCRQFLHTKKHPRRMENIILNSRTRIAHSSILYFSAAHGTFYES